jgi:penicillin-binding protein 1B
VVITSPGNGEVLALVGDRNPQYTGFNRALDARRPVGSLLKPFVFLAALESQRYSLATQVDDGPVRWQTANKTYWQPQNYDHKDHGQVALIDALAHSYNQVTARIGLQVGVKRLVEIIRRAGVNAPIEEVPSLILGAGGMTPVEVAELYQVIPAVGFTLPLRSIREVYTAEGKALKRYGLEMEQRFDPAHIQLISFAMESVIREGTAKSAYDAFPFGTRLAGKTGTTDDQRDSWFGGFSVNYNTIVWVGQDNNGKTPLTGATGALPIWTSIMSKLPNESLPQPTDTNIEWQWIDRASGARTDDSCTGARRLPIDKRGAQPTFVPCNGKATWLPDFLRH